MGTPKRKVANLSRYAEDMANLRQAREDKKKIEAYIASLEKRLKKAVGEAESAEIDGVEVFTYAKTGSYRWAEFATENSAIADQYKIRQEVDVLDKEALLRDHGGLLAAFQTRQFLVK